MRAGWLSTLVAGTTLAVAIAACGGSHLGRMTEIATIDRQTLEERIGSLSEWLLAELDAGLQRALGLPRG